MAHHQAHMLETYQKADHTAAVFTIYLNPPAREVKSDSL